MCTVTEGVCVIGKANIIFSLWNIEPTGTEVLVAGIVTCGGEMTY